MMFALAILGAYFVATAVATEKGPGGVFEWLRTAVYQRLGGDHWFFIGITCPKCLSFWVAGAFTVLLDATMTISPSEGAVIWFGITGGAWVVHHVTLLIRLTIAKG